MFGTIFWSADGYEETIKTNLIIQYQL